MNGLPNKALCMYDGVYYYLMMRMSYVLPTPHKTYVVLVLPTGGNVAKGNPMA